MDKKLTFGDLREDEIYPIYVKDGYNINEYLCQVSSLGNTTLELRILDKYGRVITNFLGHEVKMVVRCDESVKYCFYLNKKELAGLILTDLKEMKKRICKDIVKILKEFDITKEEFFNI